MENEKKKSDKNRIRKMCQNENTQKNLAINKIQIQNNCYLLTNKNKKKKPKI